VWGADILHVWSGHLDRCMQYTGGARWEDFQVVPSCAPYPLRALWGTSATNVYGVGDTETIIHYDGTWSTQRTGAHDLFAVYGSGANDVYAVGSAGTVLHSADGMTWSQAPVPVTTDGLAGVWVADANHVFIVGAAGRFLLWNGTAWTSSVIGNGGDLVAVWGTSAANVWVTGAAGQMLHYDGATWSSVPSGTTIRLRAIWGTRANDIFAGGDAATVLHFDGTTWTQIRAVDQGGSVSAIWGDGRHVIFAPLYYMLDRTSFPPGGCATSETSCSDGVDDDCDLLVDCNDPDCRTAPACM